MFAYFASVREKHKGKTDIHHLNPAKTRFISPKLFAKRKSVAALLGAFRALAKDSNQARLRDLVNASPPPSQ
jgi:hypothetical protein